MVIGVVEQVTVRRGLRRLVVVAAAKRIDPSEAVANIEGIGNFAELTVANDVDPGGNLFFNDLLDRQGETSFKGCPIQRPAGLLRFQEGQQIGWARQATDMSRQDPVGA